MSKNSPRCGNCAYWKPDQPKKGEAEYGECRVDSPQVIGLYDTVDDETAMPWKTVWPETPATEHCFRWSR